MLNSKIVDYVNKLLNRLNLTGYVGVLVYGSYVGNRANRLSDLDVMIICDNYDTQDCGSLLIDEIRVEYFIQDLNVLYQLTENEINNNDPSHLTKFATSEIVYDSDGRVNDFLCYAQGLYNTKIKPVFGDNEKFSIFSINNRLEDLEVLIDDDSFYSVYYITLERIRNLYAKINGIIDLPIMKINRIYNDEEFAKKYIASSIHKLPTLEFVELYLCCTKLDNREIMFNNLKALYDYSFGNLEFDPLKFHLKFRGRSPFRV